MANHSKANEENELLSDKRDSSPYNRNLFALGFASFFTDMSSEMVFSLLPTFLLGLPGSGIAVLGFIEGAAEALSYIFRAVSGVFSDKYKRRKLFVLAGYGLSNFVKPFLAVAALPIHVLGIRLSDRVGKAVRTSPRDALLADSVPEKRRGTAFGIHRTLDQAGAIIGPLLASAILLLLGLSIRDVFWVSLIPGAIALVIILFIVKEKVSKGTGDFHLLQGITTVLKGDFSRLLIIVGVFSLGAFNFSFILLYAMQVGVADSLIPLVYSVVNAAHVAVAIPAGVLSDRIGKEKVLLLGYGIFLLTVILLVTLTFGSLGAFLIAIFYGVYFGIIETIQRAMIPEYVQSDLKGTAYGLYYLVVGTAFFVSNVLIGFLWSNWGSATAGLYSVVFSSAALLGLGFLLKKRV